MPTRNEILDKMGLIVISEDSENFFVECPSLGTGSLVGSTLCLSKRSLDYYMSLREKLQFAGQTGVFSNDYYENSVRVLAYILTEILVAHPDKARNLVLRDGEKCACLRGTPSEIYVLYMLEHADQLPLADDRVFSAPAMDESTRPIQVAFEGIYTLSLEGFAFAKTDQALENFRMIETSILFNISRRVGSAVVARRQWDKQWSTDVPEVDEILFPDRLYNPELVSYYQLALSTSDRLLQYIAYYQILEHFFVSASEEVLDRELTNMLTSHEFSPHEMDHIHRVVKAVRTFDRETKEEKMLRSVLEKFFTPEEVIQFVESYEKKKGKHFTIETNTIGSHPKLKMHLKEVLTSVAQRIYRTRNVLVHNKDDGLPKFLPFSGQELFLDAEVEFVKYIAEQVILRSGVALNGIEV